MKKNEGIPFDGFASVIEMLRRSDSAFREKILNNMRRRDPDLARRLEANLRPAARQHDYDDYEEESRALLERSQRAAHTRNYGQ
jgi:hypothetical protein